MQATATRWQDEPAREKQISYRLKLRVDFNEDGLTKGAASTLIEAAKNGDLGSFGAFYTDGSN
jgi:hypothetical protein